MTIQKFASSFYIAHTKDGVWASGESFVEAIINLLTLIY